MSEPAALGIAMTHSTARRLRPLLATAGVLLALTATSTAALDPACRQAVEAAPFVPVEDLDAWHRLMADLGPRPTASRAHRRWLRWLRKQLRAVPGLRLTVDRYVLEPRQLERDAALELVQREGGRRPLRVAGPIPYTRLTGRRGVEAPLLHLPTEQPIAAATAAGRIVVRERAIVGVSYGVLQGLASFWYDPRATLDPDARYERETLSRQTFDDVRAAQEAGAAGLVMIEPFPRAQVAGQYQPYRGETWAMPGVVLGADEGAALLAGIRSGDVASAAIAVRGTRRRARTWSLVGTLPGTGPQTVVVASHTDGMNPIWDNGPLAMLALARHFAALPAACRPATLQFGFTSAHLYLSASGANRYADRLLAHCESVPLVVVLEHLGATEFEAGPRADGGPGRVLAPTGAPELLFVFATPTAPLLDAMRTRVRTHDLERTAVVPFTAGIANGEGRSYEPRGFPTLAAIASPWTLRNPAFGMETVDVPAMRNATLAFRDVIVDLQELPRAATAANPCGPAATE